LGEVGQTGREVAALKGGVQGLRSAADISLGKIGMAIIAQL